MNSLPVFPRPHGAAELGPRWAARGPKLYGKRQMAASLVAWGRKVYSNNVHINRGALVEASFVDLRKKSAEIIKALSRKERVTVLYRGKPAAIMEPIDSRITGESQVASQHKAFGIWADRAGGSSVEEQVRGLRRRRYGDL